MLHRAFTLIELLIVMSIVAILAGMLLPAISQVRASVRSAVCVGNQRQVAMALITYSADWKGGLPYGINTALGWSWDRSIVDQLNGNPLTALGKRRVLICPEDNRATSAVIMPRSYSSSGIAWADPLWGWAGSDRSNSLPRFTSPGTTILLYENWTQYTSMPAMSYQWQGAYSYNVGWSIATDIPKGVSRAPYYHGGRMVFSFADGHIEVLDPTTVYGMWRIR